MNKLKRLIISVAALTLLSGVAATLPARSTAAERSPQSASDNNVTGDDSAGPSGAGGSLTEQFREVAKQKVQQAKQNHKKQTEAQREKVCDAREANLTKRMSRSVTVANQYKDNIDRIYGKVKDFYTTKQLNVANYDELTANVDTAQSAAADSISALKSLDVSVDCASQTVADSVASFREAVTGSRDSLKTYRQALVDLITSLKGASTSAGGSGDETNTTAQ
jgi:hypothetical protein